MASNYTEHYGLCQWEATDQVLRTEFNEDNAKIDEALDGLAESRNCQVWITSYTGDGADSRTLTFPHRPYFVLIMGHYIQTLMMPHASHMQPRLSNGSMSPLEVIWADRSVTYSREIGGNNAYGANVEGEFYAVLAILDPNS